MRTTAECVEMALKVFRPPEAVSVWFRISNPELDGKTPKELCDSGEADRVYGLLLALAEGVTA